MSAESISSKGARKSISEKKSILAKWEQTNLSMKDYCIQENISIHSLKYWIGQFNMGRKKRRKKKDFIALEVSPVVHEEVLGPFAELIHFNGTRLLFHREVAPSFLNELLTARK